MDVVSSKAWDVSRLFYQLCMICLKPERDLIQIMFYNYFFYFYFGFNRFYFRLSFCFITFCFSFRFQEKDFFLCVNVKKQKKKN